MPCSKNINTEQKLAILNVERACQRNVLLYCQITIKVASMKPAVSDTKRNLERLTDNIDLKKAKASQTHCKHRTESGFCNKSNRQCSVFMIHQQL
jgi:hypothetical protein